MHVVCLIHEMHLIPWIHVVPVIHVIHIIHIIHVLNVVNVIDVIHVICECRLGRNIPHYALCTVFFQQLGKKHRFSNRYTVGRFQPLPMTSLAWPASRCHDVMAPSTCWISVIISLWNNAFHTQTHTHANIYTRTHTYNILYYIILCYVILYYIMLCYIILYLIIYIIIYIIIFITFRYL